MKHLIPQRWFGRRQMGRPERNAQQAHPMLSLRDEMNELFDCFFGDMPGFPAWRERAGAWSFQPSVDVVETDKALTVAVEAPGLDEKDVEVTVSGGVLSICGEKKQEKKEENADYHCVERCFGSFYREVALPPTADAEKAQAVFSKGVIKVTVPKKAAADKEKKVIPVVAAEKG